MKKMLILESEYMTLGQVLKELTIISSGGQAKWYLKENSVFIDGELETRRGRKIYAGMILDIPGEGTFFMTEKGKESLNAVE